MLKYSPAFLAGCLVLAAAPFPTEAADFPDGMRGSYDWGAEDQFQDVLDFEVGLRYVYSYGSHSLAAAGNSYSIADTSHQLEAHMRIDDHSTATFLRASAGLTFKSAGSYVAAGSGTQTFEGGTIGSIGGDFGWLPLGNDIFRAGLFVGYEDRNESPDMGWTSMPGARTQNALDIKALRLGLSARATIADTVDLSADAALVPYAWLSGTYGAYSGGAAEIDGGLYGVAGEVAVGLHLGKEAIFRVGGRGSYLMGQARLTAGGNTSDTSQLSFTRLGTFAELSYGF